MSPIVLELNLRLDKVLNLLDSLIPQIKDLKAKLSFLEKKSEDKEQKSSENRLWGGRRPLPFRLHLAGEQPGQIVREVSLKEALAGLSCFLCQKPTPIGETYPYGSQIVCRDCYRLNGVMR
jgi:hypothetical protein